jgi:hypothetical protein
LTSLVIEREYWVRGLQQRGTSIWTHTRLAPAFSRWAIYSAPRRKLLRGLSEMRGILQASMALLIMIGGADAAGADICAASVHPENFDRQRLTLEGIAAGLRKGTSHGGTKYMTFLLRSSAGCGSVFVYVPVSTALRNGDHVQVEGTFERQHLRDGSTFHNVLGATRIIALPR